MKFTYQARTQEGKVEAGTIEASNHDAAVLLLQKYNVFVTSLKEEKTGKFDFKDLHFSSGVSKKELAIFSRQLAVMLDSRVPVIQSLTSLAVQMNKGNFKKAVAKVAASVEEGMSLSEALAKYPKIFDNFYVNLVKSGELSGKISETLYYISDHLDRENEITAQVRQAMIYPGFTISVLFIVLNIIVIFLLPKVQELIKESSGPQSSFTVLTLNFYGFLEGYWWMIMLALAVVVGVLVFYFRTTAGKKVFSRAILRVPLLGDILRKVFLTRFCGNVATLMTAGISINKALQITAETVNNDVYKEIINEIEHKVSEGEKISSVLVSHQQYFPSFVIQMIKVGEETGKLDKTLLEVVNFYEKEIKRSIDLFLTLLEPLLIIFLGAIVGLVAVSVFAPLYSALGTV